MYQKTMGMSTGRSPHRLLAQIAKNLGQTPGLISSRKSVQIFLPTDNNQAVAASIDIALQQYSHVLS